MEFENIDSSFGRNLDGVLRVSRSTDGHSVMFFHPDWRMRQSMIYNNAASEGQPDPLPRWEDDDLVLDYYSFLRAGRCEAARRSELISLAVQCEEWNDEHGMGSRIKAYAVAEKSDEEIGQILNIDSEIVEYYLKLFFDVRSILYNRERMASIVFPFNPDRFPRSSSSAQREALWLAAALTGQEELLTFFTMNRFTMDDAEIDRSLKMIASMLTAQSLEYGVFMRVQGLPRPAHFDKFMAMSEVQSKQLSAESMARQADNSNQNLNMAERWMDLLDAVGVRPATARAIEEAGDERGLVTSLSITDLKSRSITIEPEGGGRVRRMIRGTNIGVTADVGE